MSDVKLQWKKLTATAKGPQKAHAEDAAWDLFADCSENDIVIAPGQTRIVPTGLAIMPPQGWSCDIRGRSGMNSKGKFAILGLVDAYYTGPWGIVIHNGGVESIKIMHHDKIAQFTVNRIYNSELQEVQDFSDGGSRGEGGFGSSGTR